MTAALLAFVQSVNPGATLPQNRHVALLVQEFEEEKARSGWQTINFDVAPISIALPLGVLFEDRSEGDITFRNADNTLIFRIIIALPAETFAMHAWMADAHSGSEAPYFSNRNDRLVSAVMLSNGLRVYLRSAMIDGIYNSMQVINAPSERAKAALIASSMQWGRSTDLVRQPNGILDQILRATTVSVPELQVAAAPPPTAHFEPEQPTSTTSQAVANGTGFFVNNTDLVTAAHVVDGCSSLSLDDGARLSVIGLDKTLDVAVLTSERRSAVWLPIDADASPLLGETVFALGFPYLDFFADQGLSVTGGNVSALPRFSDATARVMISAPVQPGNSGGPLINDSGEVLGVIVSRADDSYMLEHTGTLPQNMNFAVPTRQLIDFLNSQNVLFPFRESGGHSMQDGIPESIQQSVVTVLCY